MAVEFQFRSEQFSRNLTEWASRSKKEFSEILQQFARLVVKDVVAITPPGKAGKAGGLQSKKRGEISVKSDLARLFQPVRKAQADPGVSIPAIHKRYRDKKGRVKKPGQQYKVYSADFNKYVREQVKKVGSLAAGWNRAAAKLGYRPPAWIWRHSSPGAVEVKTSDRSIEVIMTNKVPYAGAQSGIQSRLQRSLVRQDDKLRRMLDHQVKESAPVRRKK